MCYDNLFICVILCLPSLADINVKQMADYGYYMEMTLACISVINTGSFVVRRRTGCSRDASVNCRTNCRDNMKLKFACIYYGERNATQDSATIKYALSCLSINVSVIGALKSRFVQSSIKTSRRNPAALAAHQPVAARARRSRQRLHAQCRKY